MPSLKLNIQFSKNEGLIMSPSDLSDLYLSGIPLCYPNGGMISKTSIKQKIESSQRQLENLLSIRFAKQEVTEEQDFDRQQFKNWGYVRTYYPISRVKSLQGKINNVVQITYPGSWISIKDGTDPTKFRNLHVLPNTQQDGTQGSYEGVAFSGMAPQLGYFGMSYIPNYWQIVYCTGWEADEVPHELFDAVGKLASIQVLAITGDLIFGAGIGNQSISLDGISQSYSTTKGAGKGAFSGRIQQYKDELVETLKELKAEYVGLKMWNF